MFLIAFTVAAQHRQGEPIPAASLQTAMMFPIAQRR
jgi:hypothetical protein